MSIQNLSFFGPAGIPTSFHIPNGRAGDVVVSVNVIGGPGAPIGEDVTNVFATTLDGDGKLQQLTGYPAPFVFMAVLARGF